MYISIFLKHSYSAVLQLLTFFSFVHFILSPLQELEKLYNNQNTGFTFDAKYTSDLKAATADFLIDNIEKAFNSCQSSYAKHLNFEEFCEYLLPYRIGTEPLTDWRKEFEENFIPDLYHRLPEDIDSITAEVLCNLIKAYPYGNLSTVGGSLPDYNAHLLSVMRVGNCKHYCAQAALAARYLGIPVSIDLTPQWATRSLGHEWNTLIKKSEKPLTFGIGDDCELGDHIEFIPDRVPPKVYRQTFSKQKENLAMNRKNEAIPPSLSSPRIKDVTNEYYTCSDVAVEFNFKAPKKNKFAYLAVFNNVNWIPVAWAKVNNHQATFKNLNRNILYMPGYYNDNQFIPAAAPFILDSLGNVQNIKLDINNKQTVVLSRKYQNRLMDGNCQEMVGGKFQAANKADFSDAVDLAVIDEKPESCYQIITLQTEKPYNYFRYLARPNTLGTIAELEVHNNNEKLSGEIIGTEQTIPYFIKEKAFDNNPLTSFRKWEWDSVWVGLKFEKPTLIDKIVYLPGNDDNSIRDGELYELFYWNSGWHSLGRQHGSSETYRLKYEDVPSNALFLLRNLTKGVEERVFTYQNNRQVWW